MKKYRDSSASAWRFWSRKAPAFGASVAWGAPLALGGGFFASYVAIHGWPAADWYPDTKARVAWLGIAAAVFGLVQAGAQRAWRIPVLVFCAAASAWLLAHWWREELWDTRTTATWFVAATLGVYALWEGCESLARRRTGAALPLAWSLGAGLAAQSFYFAHSESHARMTSALASALGVAFVIGLRRGNLQLARGGTLVFVLLYAGMAVANRLTADLPPDAFALILVAPLAAWLAELPLLAGRRPVTRVVFTVLLVLAPLALAAWRAHAANPPLGMDAYMDSMGY